MRYLRVKKFDDFQHYKDRNPPWIKLHRSLLDDYEFARLPDVQKAHLMLIWLYASHHEGRIPDDPKHIASKTGARKPPDLKALSQAGWLIEEPRPEPEAEGETASKPPDDSAQSASDTLASCKQDASNVLALAHSREERTRTTEKSRGARAGAPEPLPNDGHRELAKRFGLNCAFEWEKFSDHEWKGKAPRDQNRAFRNWLRKAHEFAVRDGGKPNPLDWGKVV